MRGISVTDDSERFAARGGEPSVLQSFLQSSEMDLDPTTMLARIGDRVIRFTPVEFRLLETFLRHPGQVLTREQLLSRVWGDRTEPRSNVVDVYVGRLRRKLGEGSVQTLHGVGYRMDAS